jgi:hypothetical protein
MAKKLNRKFIGLDRSAVQALTDLFYFVNNLNKTPDLSLRGGVYKEIAKVDVFTASFDGWEVGYKVEDMGYTIRRKIFLKCEQPLAEIPDAQKDPVLAAVFEVFLEKGQGMPQVDQISEFCVMVEQDIIPLLMTELKPNLISKGPLGPRNDG